MASCFALRAGLRGFDHIFTVDSAVGPACPNLRDDVMLVQFMLAVFLSRQATVPDFLSGKLPVQMDGIFGPKTKAYIKAFEQANRSTVVPDGRVDPVSFSRGAAGSKVFALNNELFAAGRLGGGFAQFGQAVSFPPALEAALFR